MDIKNFSSSVVRIGGDYPDTIDVSSFPDTHSSNGIIIDIPVYHYGNQEHFFQIRKRKDTEVSLVLVRFKWVSQLEHLPNYVGDVVFDSRDVE